MVFFTTPNTIRGQVKTTLYFLQDFLCSPQFWDRSVSIFSLNCQKAYNDGYNKWYIKLYFYKPNCFAFATNARLSNFGKTIHFDLVSIRSVACSIWFRYAFGPHMKESMKDDLFSWSAKPNHGGRRISHTFFYKGLSNKIFISPAFWLVNPFYVRPVHVSKYQPIIMEYIIPYIHCRAL